MKRKLTRDEMALWHAWKQATNRVLASVERDLQTGAGLSGADYGVLSRLADSSDGQLRQQELADSMQWDKSRLSHQLSRMEDRGLVERRRDGAKMVTLGVTRQGAKVIEGARAIHAAAVRAHLLDRIPAGDAARFLAVLERLGSRDADER